MARDGEEDVRSRREEAERYRLAAEEALNQIDKGLVIDAYVRVSLVGIELVTIDARIVIASVDTYLRFAAAVERLNIAEGGSAQALPEFLEGMPQSLAKSKSRGAIEGVNEGLGRGGR